MPEHGLGSVAVEGHIASDTVHEPGVTKMFGHVSGLAGGRHGGVATEQDEGSGGHKREGLADVEREE